MGSTAEFDAACAGSSPVSNPCLTYWGSRFTRNKVYGVRFPDEALKGR